MEYKQIVEQVGKYHYIISTSNKTILLSSNNSKSEAKEQALDKLKPNIENLIGKNIYLVKILKVSKKVLDENNTDKLKLVGGTIYANIENAEIINDHRIKNLGGAKQIFFSKKYLSDHNGIDLMDIKKIINQIHNKILNISLFDIKIL